MEFTIAEPLGQASEDRQNWPTRKPRGNAQLRYTAVLEVEEPIIIKPGERRCPSCLSKDIVPSMPRGLRDQLMRSFNRIPRHCRYCGRRFYMAVPRLPADAG
jgi:hypothetical protein